MFSRLPTLSVSIKTRKVTQILLRSLLLSLLPVKVVSSCVRAMPFALVFSHLSIRDISVKLGRSVGRAPLVVVGADHVVFACLRGGVAHGGPLGAVTFLDYYRFVFFLFFFFDSLLSSDELRKLSRHLFRSYLTLWASAERNV